MFGKWKKNFCLRILCVCVCVSEFWSQNFGPRILCLEKNFCLITGILCLKKEFLVLLYVTGILCLEKEFLSQNFVCVCLRIFVSEFLVFWKKNLFCNRNFEKESFFTCQK